MRCLVVDDSATMRWIVAESLRAVGLADPIEAEDPDEALARVAGADVVIVDWHLPAGGALKVVRRLRASMVAAGKPVLILAAPHLRAEIDRAIGLEPGAFVPTPFTPQLLKAALAQLTAAA